MTRTAQTLTTPSQPTKAAEGKQTSFNHAIESLAETPYACASLEPLSGGLLNATYRGTLAWPLGDGTRTVFIKCSAEHAHKLDLTFPLNRCIAEHMTLQALEKASMQLLQHNQVSIRIPRLYQYLPQHHTQILEDLSPTHTLHQFLSSRSAGSEDPSAAARMGEALGTWLLRFHTWSRTQVPPYLSEVIRTNTNVLDQCVTKYKLSSLERQCADPKVRQYAAEIYQSRPNDIVVHGDFSTRNILIQNIPSPVDGSDTTSLAVVDWEVCSYSDYTRDVANLMSDLYMKYYFSGSKTALSMLEGFIGAYPLRDEASVYRTVRKIGENFFHWRTYSPGIHTDEQVEEVRQLAADFIVSGAEECREGIRGSYFDCLFKSC